MLLTLGRNGQQVFSGGSMRKEAVSLVQYACVHFTLALVALAIRVVDLWHTAGGLGAHSDLHVQHDGPDHRKQVDHYEPLLL